MSLSDKLTVAASESIADISLYWEVMEISNGLVVSESMWWDELYALML